jgi:hypothetical protein
MSQAARNESVITGSALVDGQSVQMNDGALTLTRTGDRFVVRENNGDQMWLFDSGMGNSFLAATDTDRNGTFDALLQTWGDPHFTTDINLTGITDAASLSAHWSREQIAGLRAEYDVQTDYTVRDGESLVSMRTQEFAGVAPGFVVNDAGTMSYRGNDGLMREFSFDFVGLNNAGQMNFSNGAGQLAGAAQPGSNSASIVTDLAFNPFTGQDHLFQIDKKGVWGQMSQGAFINHQGNLTSGSITQSSDFTFTAQAEMQDRMRNRTFHSDTKDLYAQVAIDFVTRNALNRDDEEDEENDQGIAMKNMLQHNALSADAPLIPAVTAASKLA